MPTLAQGNRLSTQLKPLKPSKHPTDVSRDGAFPNQVPLLASVNATGCPLGIASSPGFELG